MSRRLHDVAKYDQLIKATAIRLKRLKLERRLACRYEEERRVLGKPVKQGGDDDADV